MITLDPIRAALGTSAEPPPLRNDGVHAAVALVLAGPKDALRLAMIERSSLAHDVWSGHIALPGGRASAADRSAASVAERETAEEIGIDLRVSERLGSLPDLPVRLAGKPQRWTITPVVYFAGPDLLRLQVSAEAAAAFWLPLETLWDRASAVQRQLSDHGDVLAYPAIRIERGFIWGITLRVLMLFSDVIGQPLPHFEEIPGLRE